MATVAIIQNMYQALHTTTPGQLTGMAQQVYHRFYDGLVEESGHTLQMARTLDDYQLRQYDVGPDLVICAPFPEMGNVAPGFAELSRVQATFPGVPVIVWSDRKEEAIGKSVLEDHGAAHYYTGMVLNAPDDFADLILAYT